MREDLRYGLFLLCSALLLLAGIGVFCVLPLVGAWIIYSILSTYWANFWWLERAVLIVCAIDLCVRSILNFVRILQAMGKGAREKG